jgi:surface carbohydrate biosynthesis protein
VAPGRRSDRALPKGHEEVGSADEQDRTRLVTLQTDGADAALQQARRWVFLPVEVKARGLQSRILLACAAAERGYGVVVGKKGHLNAVAAQLPRGIFVEKSCQLPLDGYEARSAIGHVVCCLDEEGVVYVDAQEYAASRLAVPILDLFERFYAWGDDQASVVAGYHPPMTGRIRVTGNPRVDLWRPELRTIYEAEASALRDRYGSFVLAPTAFAMINNSRGPSWHLGRVAVNGMLDTDEGARRAHGYLEHSSALFEAMRKAVVRVAEAVPDRTIIIRPHPSEDVASWEEAAAAADNVTVVREGPVTPWLLAADVILHSNCTTGLEGVLLGRPTIAFAPRQDPRYDQNLPNPVSQLASDEDELIDLVRANLGSGAPPPSDDDMAFIGRHISALDGPFAADRLADTFDEIDVAAHRLECTPWRRGRAELGLAGLRARRLARRLSTREAPTPDVVTESQGAATGKFPPSSLDEVRDFVDRVRTVTGRFSAIGVHELGTDVYAVVPPVDGA